MAKTQSAKKALFNSWPIVWIIFSIPFGIFLKAYNYEFVNLDDPLNFIKNRHLLEPFNQHLFWAWKSGLLAVYQPLSWHFLWLESLSGLNPTVVHTVGICLHALNSVLVWIVFNKVAQVFYRWDPTLKAGCFLGALLFSVHPLRVEPVVFNSCQPYLWSTLFSLLSTIYYLNSLQGSQIRKNRRWSLAFFTLALLGKAIAFSLPLVFLIFQVWHAWNNDQKASINLRTLSRFLWRDKLYWALSASALLLAFLVRPFSHSSSSIGIPFYFFANTFIKFLFPFSLAPFYPLPEKAMATVLITIALALFAGMGWKLSKSRYFSLAPLFLVALALPGISSCYTEQMAFMDRSTYLTSIPLCFLLALWATNSSRRMILLGMSFVFILLTVNQIPVWKNSKSLWKHALQTDANRSGKTYGNLGATYLEKNDTETAEEYFLMAFKLDPELPEVRNYLAITAINRKDFKLARTHLQEAIRLKPNFADAQNNLGYIEFVEGNIPEALKLTQEALISDPTQAKTHELRLNIFLAIQKGQEAEKEARAAIYFSEADSVLSNSLAKALLMQNKVSEALQVAHFAIQKYPSDIPLRITAAHGLELSGNVLSAINILEEAQKVDPNNDQVRQKLTALKMKAAPKIK